MGYVGILLQYTHTAIFYLLKRDSMLGSEYLHASELEGLDGFGCEI